MEKIDAFRPKEQYNQILDQRKADGLAFSEKYHDQFLHAVCPACGTEGVPAFEKWGFGHDKCSDCNTVFVSPRPPEELLIRYYNEFQAPNMWTALLLNTDTERKRMQYQPRVKMILDQVTLNPNSIAVDIGAGSGAFCLALKDSGKFSDVIAMDIAEDSITACLNIGLTAHHGSVSDLAPDSVDFISMNDLIEHLYNPYDFLRSCYRVLKPGGVISIATPNGEGFDFRILKSETKNITPPEHINYFNPESMETLLTRGGFSDVKVTTPGQLDVGIITREMEQGLDMANNEWLAYLLSQRPDTLDAFQTFLASNNLSSHMLAIAIKR